MIKIRLARLGAKKKPIYRVVVADVRNARNNGRWFVLKKTSILMKSYSLSML